MIAGVLFPSVGLVFEPYLLVVLGLLLFVNLIRLNPKDLLITFVKPKNIIVLSVLKLLILPLVIYAITSLLYPKMTLSVTLLSGISTALGAPFAVNFLGRRANLSTIVGVIVVTSLAVPFTLPALVYFLFKEQISIPIFHMMFLLAMSLFIPLFAGWITRRKAYRLAQIVDEKSLPFSLILIVLINFPIFAEFSSYFLTEPVFVIQLVVVVFLLFAVYGLAGYYYRCYYYYSITLIITEIKGRREINDDNNNNNNGREENKQDRITGLLAMTYISNILVVVLAHQFFDIQTEALAAFYQLPYYGGLFLLKKLID
jgi:bile acid:Na+ symporter, BASS family